LPHGLQLPQDLKEFYSRYSEAKLFGDYFEQFQDIVDPRYHILPPERFVQIGIAICGELSEEPIQHSWYALADVRDGNYIAIDCHPDHLGYCYDAFHETIDSLDYCKVIAHSLTELMNRAAESGDEAWWVNDSYETYGYADQFRSPHE